MRARPLLGTFVEISVLDSVLTEPQVQQVINNAFDAIATVHQLMSFQESGSQLSLLNREAHLQPVTVHPWLYAVLLRAQRLYRASAGLFDCTVADVLVDWSFLPAPSATVAKVTTQADVQLLPNFQVGFKKPLWIDLSGIAKGFAVDMAIHCLQRAGIQSAVVNAGGDLRVLGEASHPVLIRHPANPAQLVQAGALANGALATSGIYNAQQAIEGKLHSHLVVPATRETIMAPLSYSVIAPTAWMADGLTKVVAASADAEHPALQLFAAQAFILQ